MRKVNAMIRDKVGAVLIVIFSFLAILLYSWQYFPNVKIEKCKPNVQISIRKCSAEGKSKSNLIVQECEFKNISKYPITIGYSPGKFYQKYWSYDIDGSLLDRGKPIADFPEVLASKAVTRGRIAYHPDTDRIIVCPLDPAKFEEI